MKPTTGSSRRGTALVVGSMFGDVDRRAAIFSAKRGALTDAKEDKQDWGNDPAVA
jgi:hypothetical protein